MSTSVPIPERWAITYADMKVIPEEHSAGAKAIAQLIEELGTAESLVRDLAKALLPYRMEHSKNNCYYAGNAGPVCDECKEVDRLLSRIPKELLP